MFGAYHHESKTSFTKLAKLIDIPKCINEINTHRLAEYEYSNQLRTTASKSTIGNIYFNNFGFKIINTPTALANGKSSFDFVNKTRSLVNQSELTESKKSMKSVAEKTNPFVSHQEHLLESMQVQMGKQVIMSNSPSQRKRMRELKKSLEKKQTQVQRIVDQNFQSSESFRSDLKYYEKLDEKCKEYSFDSELCLPNLADRKNRIKRLQQFISREKKEMAVDRSR
jgi:hypothetical protein